MRHIHLIGCRWYSPTTLYTPGYRWRYLRQINRTSVSNRGYETHQCCVLPLSILWQSSELPCTWCIAMRWSLYIRSTIIYAGVVIVTRPIAGSPGSFYFLFLLPDLFYF